MGSSIPDPHIRACFGSKRDGSDLEGGADEPALKRSRSAENEDSAATKADASHPVEADIDSVTTTDTGPPEARLEEKSTHDDQGDASGIPGPSDAPDGSNDHAVTAEPSARSITLNNIINNLANDTAGLASDTAPAAHSTPTAGLGHDKSGNVKSVASLRKELTPYFDRCLSYESISNERQNGDLIWEHWEQLNAVVQEFVGLGLPTAYSWDMLSPENQAEISMWAANAPDHFNSASPFDVQNIFIAWVHHILYELIFSGQCQKKWNGDLWQSFGVIQASVGEHVTDSDNTYNAMFHHWRNLTTRLVSRQNPNQKHLDTCWLKEELEKRLGSIQAEYLKNTPDLLDEANPNGLPSCFRSLLKAVLNMDSIMIVNRVRVRMMMCHPDTHEVNGFDFEEEHMDKASVSPGFGMKWGAVDYIQRPELVVHGIQTGMFHNFGAKSFLFPLGWNYEERGHTMYPKMVVVLHKSPVEPQESGWPATEGTVANDADANE